MKLKQITAALLLAACTLSCGCNNGGESGSKGPVTAGIVTEPGVTGYVEGTLHNVNVKYDAPVGNFAVNGKSDYKLVIGKTNNSKAAGFIAMHVLNATKAKVDIIEYSQDLVIDENTKYIVIGCEDKFVELGGEVPTYETIGVSGYRLSPWRRRPRRAAHSFLYVSRVCQGCPLPAGGRASRILPSARSPRAASARSGRNPCPSVLRLRSGPTSTEGSPLCRRQTPRRCQ